MFPLYSPAAAQMRFLLLFCNANLELTTLYFPADPFRIFSAGFECHGEFVSWLRAVAISRLSFRTNMGEQL